MNKHPEQEDRMESMLTMLMIHVAKNHQTMTSDFQKYKIDIVDDLLNIH